jgi:hypothetical protein
MYATVYAAVTMPNLDLFVVNAALPDIGRTFHGCCRTGYRRRVFGDAPIAGYAPYGTRPGGKTAQQRSSRCPLSNTRLL